MPDIEPKSFDFIWRGRARNANFRMSRIDVPGLTTLEMAVRSKIIVTGLWKPLGVPRADGEHICIATAGMQALTGRKLP
eukprot:871344-Amorphochlora_amoeboformis.AAC.1